VPCQNEKPSTRDCEEMARHLFCLIDEQHGVLEARRIFANWAKPPSVNQLKQTANLELLSELYFAGPERNIERFARERAARNQKLSAAERTARGAAANPDAEQLARHIRKLIALTQWPVKQG
jgi:hypothetical protein